jgi:hypothetical protein
MQIIPLSKSANIYVDYLGGSLKFGRCFWNNNMRCWVADISYRGVTANRCALRAGANIVKQFAFPFGVLIVNRNNTERDPGNFESIVAYILDAEEIGDLV